jgi:hypothetical protein
MKNSALIVHPPLLVFVPKKTAQVNAHINSVIPNVQDIKTSFEFCDKKLHHFSFDEAT